MNRNFHRLLVVAAVIGLAVAALLVLGWSPRAVANVSCSNFAAVAASQGVQGEVNHTGFLVDEEDGDAPAAQAAVDSEGDSSGYAADPYPGVSVLTALGLANVPPSDYPALAQSSYPTQPHAAVSAPGVSLTSDSKSLSSSADATASAQSGTSASVGSLATTAQAQCGADGTVSANAASDDQALNFGGLLVIGVVHSSASAVSGEDGKTVLNADLQVGAITVGGQRAELTPAGLVAAGATVPLPSADLLDQELSAAGISVRYLVASRDPDGNGIVAPGLAVTLSHQAYATEPTTVTFVFGQSYARAQGTSAAGDQSAIPPGAGRPDSSLIVAAPSTPSAVGSAPQSFGPGGAAATPVLGSLSGTPPVTQAGASHPQGRPSPEEAVLPGAVNASALSLYVIVLVGGVSVFGMTLLFRNIGLRLKWM